MKRQLIFIITITTTLTALLAACGGGGGTLLDGTEWVLTSLDGDTPVGGATFTLAFNDGQLNGKAGCNSYFGDYDQSGNTLSFPMIGMTEMFCMDPEGVMEQESTYVGILSRVDTFSVDGSSLRMDTDDGAFLVFEAVE
jgi:heat shock protein HslJ